MGDVGVGQSRLSMRNTVESYFVLAQLICQVDTEDCAQQTRHNLVISPSHHNLPARN